MTHFSDSPKLLAARPECLSQHWLYADVTEATQPGPLQPQCSGLTWLDSEALTSWESQRGLCRRPHLQAFPTAHTGTVNRYWLSPPFHSLCLNFCFNRADLALGPSVYISTFCCSLRWVTAIIWLSIRVEMKFLEGQHPILTRIHFPRKNVDGYFMSPWCIHGQHFLCTKKTKVTLLGCKET